MEQGSRGPHKANHEKDGTGTGTGFSQEKLNLVSKWNKGVGSPARQNKGQKGLGLELGGRGSRVRSKCKRIGVVGKDKSKGKGCG